MEKSVKLGVIGLSGQSAFFEVDHFVPQAEIKRHPSLSYLVNDYRNLVYSCRNCNGEKSDIFEGYTLNIRYATANDS